MRQRQDYYTLCPSCENRIALTLAARLQSARMGTLCQCERCQHEWNCIQEWVFRDAPQNAGHPAHPVVSAVAPAATAGPGSIPAPWVMPAPQPAAYQPVLPQPVAPQPALHQPPRPHLPMFQPGLAAWQASGPQAIPAAPMMSAPAATPPQPAAPALPARAPVSSPVPAPHAWSFERQTQTSPAAQYPHPSQASRER